MKTMKYLPTIALFLTGTTSHLSTSVHGQDVLAAVEFPRRSVSANRERYLSVAFVQASKSSSSSKSHKSSSSSKSHKSSSSSKSHKSSSSAKSHKSSSSAKSHKSSKHSTSNESRASTSSKSSKSSGTLSGTPTPNPIPDTYTPIILVVTHGSSNDNFWDTWKYGADSASKDSAHLMWNTVGYDATLAADTLRNGCNSSDAVIVTVPYSEDDIRYRIMDNAINECIDTGKPVFTTNTDTYHNERVYAFIGSSNYDMGVNCAMTLLYGDPDIVTGRTAPDSQNLLSNSSMKLQVYRDASNMLNEGIRQRLEGLNNTFSENGIDLDFFLPTGNTDCPCAQEHPDGVIITDGLQVTIDEVTYMYDASYGMDMCARHDENLKPTCSQPDPPEWCERSWCYVDPENCDAARFDLSATGQYTWTDFPGLELPYSYETCGEPNLYDDFFENIDSVEPTRSDDTLTIVFSSNWAPEFLPQVFLCGEEAFDMPGIPSFGQSPFMQGINAVSSAIVAAKLAAEDMPWRAAKGNSNAVATSEVMSVDISPDIVNGLSHYGQAVITNLNHFNVERGTTWDVWHDAVFDGDWILQHPPPENIGHPSAELHVPESCTDGEQCDVDFGLYECNDDSDCMPKDFCPVTATSGPTFRDDECDGILDSHSDTCTEHFFQAGMCREVLATVNHIGGIPKKLCVGHSYGFYEEIYKLIIETEKIADITSLDSFDSVGTAGGNGGQFGAAVRNAITYLESSGKEIHVKCHFGSISLSSEDTKVILESITRDIPPGPTNITVWVNTYNMLTDSSWNHGKIVAVDGKKLITGGSNYYVLDYLQEDPVHDVSIGLTGGPAITAHRFAEKLWRSSCGDGFPSSWISWNTAHTSWRTRDGEILADMTDIDCPPAFDAIPEENDRPETGTSVIPAARLGPYGGDLQGGSYTADIAMIALMENAEDTIKWSQQDMLPLILDETGCTLCNGGYMYNDGYLTLASFEDTWRIIGSIAKAIKRNVNVHMLVSAPCSFAANNRDCYQGVGTFLCPRDGTQGDGYDYWADVFQVHTTEGWKKWPEARPIDMEWGHFLDGQPFPNRRKLIVDDNRKLNGAHRRLAYGYGWTLDHVADWIFAYYMINKDARPTNVDGSKMNADQIVDHICSFAHIGHIRLTAGEPTYKRGENPGGQVGNHAKVLMVDEEAFYIGSNNAYGAGLAEFGLIIDDSAKTAEFNTLYFEPLWHEALGTLDSPGLVSGSTSIDGRCRWKDRLAERTVAPWNNLQGSMCTTFNSEIECQEAGCNWITLTSPVQHCTYTASSGGCENVVAYCAGEDKENGSWCSTDEECKSNRCATNECIEKLAIGEQCEDHGDCDSGWCEGTCGENQLLENGQACTSDDLCRSGRCTTDSVCADKLDDGQSCEDNNDCKADICTSGICGKNPDGGDCDSDSNCVNNFCNSQGSCGELPNGECCSADEDCDTGYCAVGTIWSTCEDLLEDGASCVEHDDCITDFCDVTLPCKSSWWGTTCGKCSDGSVCEVHSDCTSDHCNESRVCGKLENGISCEIHSDCISEFCHDGECSDLLETGSVCSENSECKSQLCQDDYDQDYNPVMYCQ